MWVSPTEPDELKALGSVTWFPEGYGVDIMWMARGMKFGVQRKEISDLLSSVGDGRLAVESKQWPQLQAVWLVVEGKINWTLDGMMVRDYGKPWSKEQFENLLRGCQVAGAIIERTESVEGTVGLVRSLVSYTTADHASLNRRPGPTTSWGRAGHRDYQLHLLKGLPGVGDELAGRIVDLLGMPFGWRVGKEELSRVPGLGKKKVDKIWEALESCASD